MQRKIGFDEAYDMLEQLESNDPKWSLIILEFRRKLQEVGVGFSSPGGTFLRAMSNAITSTPDRRQLSRLVATRRFTSEAMPPVLRRELGNLFELIRDEVLRRVLVETHDENSYRWGIQD